MSRGLFVTGTDTGVGKTVVSAALLHRYERDLPLRYWKPIQTGPPEDDDTAMVHKLVKGTNTAQLDEGIRLSTPVSPHLAAALEGRTIDFVSLTALFNRDALTDRWIVEGAGGVLVPINHSKMMVDLIKELGLAVVVVSRSSLGTINHTLLTLKLLRSEGLTVAGVAMVGELNQNNRLAIEEYGKVSVIAEMPFLDTLSSSTLSEWARSNMDPDGQLEEWLL